MSHQDSTVYIGNLSAKVTEELLYELFLQGGPVANVNIPSVQGVKKSFGFVHFKHPSSVPYVIELLDGIVLFGKAIKVALPKGATCNRPPPSLQSRIPPVPFRSAEPRLAPNPVQHNHSGENRDGDLRDYLAKSRPRHADHMKPSSRLVKRNRSRSPHQKEMDAIPDLLGSSIDLLYTADHRNKDKKPRDWESDRRNDDWESNRRNHDWKFHHHNDRNRHSRHNSNKRKHF